MDFVRRLFLRRKGRKEYAAALRDAVADCRIDESETAKLAEIQARCGLREEDLLEAKKDALHRVYCALGGDNRITETERQTLQGVTRYLGIGLADVGRQEGFNTAFMLAQIDSGKLPEVTIVDDSLAGVILKPNEVAHWVAGAVLVKRKNVTTRVNYGGVTTSIKICRGVHYRTGSVKVARETTEVIATEDAGTFWLTNERIGFKGPRKHFTLTYAQIGAFELGDGVLQIFKNGRENPYLIFLTDYDVPCSIISFILNAGATERQRA
jgi:hypothetical protein